MEEALESTTDAQEWRLEVERVLPALKIHVRHDNRVRLASSPAGPAFPAAFRCVTEKSWEWALGTRLR